MRQRLARFVLPLVLFSTVAAHSQVARTQPLDGQIGVDSTNRSWLKRHGGGPFYLAAIGDPEGFLYRGTRNPDGTRDGDQMAIIRKLVRQRQRHLHDRRPNAWRRRPDGCKRLAVDLSGRPSQSLDPRTGLNDAILRQWESWFAEMDRNGIVIYFFFYDDVGRPEASATGAERRPDGYPPAQLGRCDGGRVRDGAGIGWGDDAGGMAGRSAAAADGHVAAAPRDAFYKPGSGGHSIYIVPSLDLVIVKLGGRDEQYAPENTRLTPLAPRGRVHVRRFAGWLDEDGG